MSEVLSAAGVRPAEVGAVVVGVGPGPFTSLRVGMVTGASFGAALGVPVRGVCSLDGIGAATAGLVGVVTDARRRELFWARYQDGSRVGEPGVAAPAEVAAGLLAAGVHQVTGPGVGLYPEAFTRFTVLGEGACPGAPAPAILVRLAADDIRQGRATGPLTPLYLRRPDAAEPRPSKLVTASVPDQAAAAGTVAG